jgi:hypothetical protein
VVNGKRRQTRRQGELVLRGHTKIRRSMTITWP